MRNRLIGLGFALTMSLLSYAQLSYRFRNYNINDGLSQSCVLSIVQDNIGTIWLGTQDGLNRFDGQQFQVFTSDDTPGLESEYIHASLKDSDGKLWFGTSNGLTVFIPEKEVFKTYQLANGTAMSIESIVESNTGDLYIGTLTQGLAVYHKKTQKVTLVSTKITSKRVQYVSFLTDDLLLVSTEDRGAFIYNIRTKLTQAIVSKTVQSNGWIINDAEHFNHSNYLLSTNKGLWLYNSESNSVVPFLTQIEKEFGITEISDVLLKSTTEFFIATQSKGLLTVKNENQQYVIYQSRQDIFQKNALLYDELNKLFCDQNGSIWIATQRGLSCFDPNNKGFLGVGPSGNLKQGIPSSSVWGFAENPDASSMFIASDFAISHLNRKTGTFDQYYIAKGSGKNETSILSICYINQHELLVGCTDGFYVVDYRGPSYSVKKVPLKKIENPASFDRVYRIAKYKDNFYFLATKGGVLLYNHQTGSVQSFVSDPKNPKNSMAPGICRVIYKGMDGTFYFASSAGGLYQLKKNSDGNLIIGPCKWNQSILRVSKDYISCLFQDSPNILWIGTSGSGVLCLNLKTGKLDRYTKKDGLPNNFIYGIEPDAMGHLWLSTNKGLCRFSKSTHACSNFTEVNGLMSNEFNTGAYFSSKTGELFFGGIAGYNFFFPNKLNEKQAPIEVSFIKFRLDDDWLRPGDKNAPFTTAFSEVSTLSLPYNQRSFSIRFVSSDLMNPELVDYKYRLVGSDEEEVYLGNATEIRFNALQPGNYTLEVYARRKDGEWNTLPASITLEIAAPFWMKWWFYVIVVLIVTIVVIVFIRSRIDLARRDQVRLEMKIVARTKEIRAQNEKIESQKEIIQNEKNKVEEQKRLLQIEKDKSEKLLRNIIPESTAEELKNKGRASARAYKTVSVLFTDFVGFTKIAEGLKPTELVLKLDIYFRKFDEIIVKNNLEKIKTIGDAYMCAGGVPVRNNTNPIDAVLAALQIQDYMSRLKHEAIANGTEYWELRLGINTGEVTAGVIGSERLAYDIWGATVNQAQRMEMMGDAGRVTISGATFKFIEPFFECTFRGKVQSKSKGLIDMFTVERIKPELSVNGEGLIPNDRFQQIVNLHLYSSINYYKAERHIMKELEKKLSPKLHYHSIAHTKDVVRAIERYALLEGVTDEGLFLLKSAATYHDAGFVESYEKNEAIGARMAEEILPKYGYSQQHIEQIKELIFVTEIPHHPKNLLEEIICDADLDYLGRDDFHEIADKLRLELREHGKIDSDRQWDEMQVAFLKHHRYFTPTAIASRQQKKLKNLQEVMQRLERNEYQD
jgi:ligand-binding sensor domain-containing protein/class 3 adenylate cyclase/predicted metal-dependent HD superfamily phosphohydrolase